MFATDLGGLDIADLLISISASTDDGSKLCAAVTAVRVGHVPAGVWVSGASSNDSPYGCTGSYVCPGGDVRHQAQHVAECLGCAPTYTANGVGCDRGA